MKDSIFIVMEFYFTIQLLLGFLQSLMVVLVFLNATCFGGIFKSSMLKCNLWIHLLLFSCILCLGTSIFLFLCLSLFLLSIPFFLPFPFFFWCLLISEDMHWQNISKISWWILYISWTFLIWRTVLKRIPSSVSFQI